MKTKTNKLPGNGQKQTEVMQASLEVLPLIINNIPQAVFWKNRDLVFLGCNQAFVKDAGLSSPDEIIG
jgi:rsbT co-antagonist protein RsbR